MGPWVLINALWYYCRILAVFVARHVAPMVRLFTPGADFVVEAGIVPLAPVRRIPLHHALFVNGAPRNLEGETAHCALGSG